MTNDRRLQVTYEGAWIYDILLKESFDDILKELDALGYTKSTKMCIVSDSNLAKLYMNELKDLLQGEFDLVETFVFEAGESSKTLDTVKKLYEHLIINHFTRNDLLIALGGGVTGDMTGYTAATYLRGIDFVQIPTTLLAQVDSSIGGKTGVDFDQYKNMVGAFHQPKLVYMNLDTLKTLPKEQFACGMAEALKSGLIRNDAYFRFLIGSREEIWKITPDQIRQAVDESCRIKREVVQKDPKEKGERALLNFGHTIGHAIEKLSDFTLCHGECVALGMTAASYISWKIGGLSKEELNLIEETLKNYQLPVRLEQAMDAGEILAATKSDKKMENGRVKFILLHGIGDAYISQEVSDDLLSEGIRYLMS